MPSRILVPAAFAGLLLSACGSEPVDETRVEVANATLSELAVNSAKRQCVNVAVMQQVPTDAARDVCDCTVQTMIDEQSFTPEKNPTDAELDGALDGCIESYLAQADSQGGLATGAGEE